MKIFAIKSIFSIILFCNFCELIRPINLYSEQVKIDSNYLKWVPKSEYILGSGDLLNIIILRDDPKLNVDTVIDQNGTIFLPEIERIYISGLTINELKTLLKEKYKNIIKETNIEITIKQQRNIKVYIKGEVITPGLYGFDKQEVLKVGEDFTNNDYKENSLYNFEPTVFDAIRKSGGITRYSDLRNIQIIRQNNLSNGGGKIKTNLNLLSVLRTGDTSQNIALRDKDIITVFKSTDKVDSQIQDVMRSNINSKYINIFVTGRVYKPGPIKIPRNSDLNTALALAGGTRAIRGPIVLHRYSLDGTLKKQKIRYKKNSSIGTKNNPYLAEGDIINVNQTPYTIASEVISEITTPFVGVYTIKNLINDF